MTLTIKRAIFFLTPLLNQSLQRVRGEDSAAARAHAYVFDPDPLSTAHATYGDPGFKDNGDADSPELTAQLKDVELRALSFNGTHYELNGPWAKIVDIYEPYNGLFSQTSPFFNFTRSQDGFEAVNAYYHIDKVMRWINVDLGLNIHPYQYTGGVQFDPHHEPEYGTGSVYDETLGVIRFSCCNKYGDNAEDAGVIVHELGHALHDWVTQGGMSMKEGLSEGVADYAAASYKRSIGLWSPQDPEYHYVAGWAIQEFFLESPEAIPFYFSVTNADVAYNLTYPIHGTLHQMGMIWGTCNMKIWDTIGRFKSDRAHWSGLRMTGIDTNQEEAAQAVLQAASNLKYPCADIQAMHSIYQGCGYDVIAPVCNPEEQ